MNYEGIIASCILPTTLSSLEKIEGKKPLPKNISKKYFDITEFQNISRVIMQITSVVPLCSVPIDLE